MAYNYDDAFIRDRVRSGKDKERAQKLDALAARATQPPHDDDAQALYELKLASGVADPNQGYATMDAKNYGRMLLGDIGGGQFDYGKAHDGGGLVGSLGKALKTAAPIAALAIPGIGPLAAAGISAGGSALGGALAGDQFSLGKTLMAGAAGYGGNKLLGGQGVNGLFGGGATSRLPQDAMGRAASGAVPPFNPAGGSGGLLGKVFGNGQGGVDLNKVLGTVGTVAGGYQAAKTQDQANQQRQMAIGGATNDWNQRAPLRAAGQQGLLGLGSVKAPDLSQVFADPGNPFYKPPVPLGGMV